MIKVVYKTGFWSYCFKMFGVAVDMGSDFC